jgi:hypothetical protein
MYENNEENKMGNAGIYAGISVSLDIVGCD